MYDKDYYQNVLFSQYQFNLERQRVFEFYYYIIKKRKKKIRRVLDIGCAYGYFLRIFQKNKIPEIYGIDISGYALEIAKRFCEDSTLLQIDLSEKKSPFPHNFFDVITAIDLIEHLNNVRYFLNEAHRILKVGGLFFLITPNPHSLVRKMYFKIKGREEDPTHINLKSINEWIKEFKRAGFEDIEVKGCLIHGFPPLTDLRDRLGNFFLIKPILVPFNIGERFYIFLKKIN